MKNRRFLILFFIFFIYIVFLFFLHRVAIPFSGSREYLLIENQHGSSDFDTFLRRNLGFGVDVSSKELGELAIACDKLNSPKYDKNNSTGEVVCGSDNRNPGVFIAWIKTSKTQNNYSFIDDTAKKYLDIKTSSSFHCYEDKSLVLSIKMPKKIYNCSTMYNGVNHYYSVIFLNTVKIRDTVTAVVVFSKDKNSLDDRFKNIVKHIVYIHR